MSFTDDQLADFHEPPPPFHHKKETSDVPLGKTDKSILLRETSFVTFLSDPHRPAQ